MRDGRLASGPVDALSVYAEMAGPYALPPDTGRPKADGPVKRGRRRGIAMAGLIVPTALVLATIAIAGLPRAEAPVGIEPRLALSPSPSAEPIGRPVGRPVGRPALTILDGPSVTVRAQRVNVGVAWSASDAGDAPPQSLLQSRQGGGPWTTIASAAHPMSTDAELVPGTRYDFRVLSDGVAGTTTTSETARTTIVLRDSSSDRIHKPKGPWKTRRTDALGGSVLASTKKGARIRSSFQGSGVAFVALVGPARGSMSIRLDQGPWGTVDLAAPTRSARTVVYSEDLERGRHTLEMRVKEGTVTMDAILILR